MATAGNTTIGGTPRDYDNNFKGFSFTMPEDGTITDIVGYFGTSTGDTYRGILYSMSGSTGTLRASSATSTTDVAEGWHTLSLTSPYVATSGTVFVAGIAASGTLLSIIYYDTVSAADMVFDFGTVGGSVAAPPTGITLDSTTRGHSVYVIYTPAGGGGPTPQPMYYTKNVLYFI